MTEKRPKKVKVYPKSSQPYCIDPLIFEDNFKMSSLRITNEVKKQALMACFFDVKELLKNSNQTGEFP